ncbi:MAG: hypothetical protein IJU44_05610 [Kiritimatiellae bacterium]|nr:hypothetical protein [Kiritimatiellia bacterium]
MKRYAIYIEIVFRLAVILIPVAVKAGIPYAGDVTATVNRYCDSSQYQEGTYFLDLGGKCHQPKGCSFIKKSWQGFTLSRSNSERS